MRKQFNKKEQDELDSKEIESYKSKFDKTFSYVVISCGILLFFVGLYLIITNQLSIGHSLSGRSGNGGGQTMPMNGWFSLILGGLILLLPSYELIKKFLTK